MIKPPPDNENVKLTVITRDGMRYLDCDVPCADNVNDGFVIFWHDEKPDTIVAIPLDNVSRMTMNWK
jgi:uncharacterized protein YjhX (UPF0386 family)